MSNIKYISSSQFKDFLSCPCYYYNKHILLKQESDNDEYVTLINQKYFNFGSYVHKVLEIFLKTKMDILGVAKSQISTFGIEIDEFIKAKKIFEFFVKRPYLKYKLLESEKTYRAILPSGIALRGTIDCIFEIDSKTILINDFKTGDMPLTQDSVESSLQLKIYALMVKNLFPKYKNVICQIDFLGGNDIFEKKVDDKWLNGVEDYLEPIYTKISLSEKEDDFTPKFNSKCGSCEFYPKCPLIKKLEKLKVNPLTNFVGKNINFLAEKYLEYTSLSKIADKNSDLIKGLIVDNLKQIGYEYTDKEWGSVKYSNNRLTIKTK